MCGCASLYSYLCVVLVLTFFYTRVAIRYYIFSAACCVSDLIICSSCDAGPLEIDNNKLHNGDYYDYRCSSSDKVWFVAFFYLNKFTSLSRLKSTNLKRWVGGCVINNTISDFLCVNIDLTDELTCNYRFMHAYSIIRLFPPGAREALMFFFFFVKYIYFDFIKSDWCECGKH